MNIRQLVGIAGSLALFIGAFCPLIKIPILGSLNYFRSGEGDGVIIIGFAVMALVFSLIKAYKVLWLPVIGSTVVLIATYNTLTERLDEAKRSLAELEGNPFGGFAEAAVQSIQLEWGWAILAVGVLLIGMAALLDMGSENIECQHCAELIKPNAKLCRYCGKDQPNNRSELDKSRRIAETPPLPRPGDRLPKRTHNPPAPRAAPPAPAPVTQPPAPSPGHEDPDVQRIRALVAQKQNGQENAAQAAALDRVTKKEGNNDN